MNDINFTAQSLPLQFYAYTIMPLFLWWISIIRILQKYDLACITEMILNIKGLDLFEMLLYLIGIELLVKNNNVCKMFNIIFNKGIVLLLGMDIF